MKSVIVTVISYGLKIKRIVLKYLQGKKKTNSTAVGKIIK